MTVIDKYLQNPSELSSEEKKEIKGKLDKIKQEINKWQLYNITIEQFESLSWEEIERNIKSNEDWELYVFDKPLSYWRKKAYWDKEKRLKFREYLQDKNYIEYTKKQIQEKDFLVNILNIWINKAYQIKAGIWFKWATNDYDIIWDKIEEIFLRLKEVNVPTSKEIFEIQVKNIFKAMQEAESQESIIWSSDIEDIEDIFLNEDSIEQKEIKIFNLMRYRWLSWNSEWVKEIVADKILEKDSRFNDINIFLNEVKLEEILETYISFWNEESIELIDEFGWFGEDYSDNWDDLLEKLSNLKIWDKKLWDKLAFKLIKTKIQIEEKIARWIKEEWKRYNKEIKSKWWKEIEYSVYLSKIQQSRKQETIKAIIDVYKHILIRQKIKSLDYRWKEDENLTWLYANLTWLWPTEYSDPDWEWQWDFATIADNHIDLAIDFAVNIAIWAITMWGWILAIKWTHIALKTAEALAYANKTWKVGTYITEWFESLAEWWRVAKTIYKTGKWVSSIKNLKAWEYLIDKWAKIWTRLLRLEGGKTAILLEKASKVWGMYKIQIWEKIIKVWDIGSFISSSSIEWISFYEGATIASNLIFSENFSDWNKWLLDKKELVKNIMFMWTLNSLRFFSLNSNIWVIEKFSQKIPAKYLEKESIRKVLSWTWYAENAIKEGSVMFWISWLTDIIVWEQWHPSVRSYIEFIVLLQVMNLKNPWSMQKIKNFIKTHK